jgi:cytidylate kinase
MAVITISRQYGSLGNVVVNMVAQRLGYRVAMRDLINQAALRAGAPVVALAVIDELHLLGVAPTPEEYTAYIRAVQTVIEELAAEGNVILAGRGGQAVLHNRPGVLHVKMVAPLEVRAQRLAERHDISLAAARAQARASDRERRLYLKRFYNLDWNDPLLYDLVINTASLSAEAACDLICLAVQKYIPRSDDRGLSRSAERDLP